MNPRLRAGRPAAPRGRWRVGRRGLVAVLLALCCLTAGAGPAAAQADGGVPTNATEDPRGAESDDATGDVNATNETSILRHAHPDTVAGDDDVGRVEQYLVERLAERLDESSVELEAGRYETARALVGSRYDEYLRGYVSVADRTGRADAARTAAAFDRAGRDQRRFVGAVESYETTYDEYEAARDRGDSVETRRLARELDVAADRAEGARVRLEADLPALEAASGEEFTAIRRSVSTVGTDVANRQAAVREAEFVTTTLTVERANATGSYLDPIGVVVRLTDADGLPVADHAAAFDVGEQRLTATTDADGLADLRYRPTTAPVGEGTVPVRYVPPPTSPYFRSGTTIPVTVTQVTPSVAVEATRTVSFGVPLVVTGRVTAAPDDGGAPVPVAGVPVAIRLNDRPLRADTEAAEQNLTSDAGDLGDEVGVGVGVANVTVGSDPDTPAVSRWDTTGPVANESAGVVRTDDEGRFRLEATLPVDVAPGAHRVVATVPGGHSPVEPEPELAIAAASGTASVTVEAAAAELTVWGANFDPASGVVSVRGRLTVVRGDPVAGVPVGVTFLGTALGESTTDVDGRFRGSFAVPAGALDRADSAGYDFVPVVAVATGTGTNLEPTRSEPVFVAVGDARSRLPARGTLLAAPDPAVLLATLGVGPDTAPMVAAGVAALVLGVVVVVRRRRRRRVVVDAAARGRDDRTRATDDAFDERTRPERSGGSERAVVEALLGAAERAQADGDAEAATRYAYLAARRHLVEATDVADRTTHRQFAAAVGGRLPDDTAVTFAGLTDRFERTAFSGSSTDSGEATVALEAAREVIAATADDPAFAAAVTASADEAADTDSS